VSIVSVKSLTRECQYCYDDQYGRSRCGRLAVVAHPVRVGNKTQLTFRCTTHKGLRNDTTLRFVTMWDSISNTVSSGFGLGYNP